MSRRLRYVIGFPFALVVLALGLDYASVRSKEKRLSSAVAEMGGRMGSLPAWPLGTEYRITFERPLHQQELVRLSIANRMRGWVGIAFRDCELSEAERSSACNALPACHLFVVQDNRMAPIDGR
jgi:hypothetical protein